MTVYNRTSPSDGTAITAAYFDGELAAIETAVNDIDDTNIGTGAIGNSKLANPKSYFSLSLKADVASGQAIATDRQDVTTVPCTATLVAVKVCCVTKADGGGTPAHPQVDVYLEGGTPATILSGVVTLVADLTVYSGTVATSSFSANDRLTLRVTTDATGSVTSLDVVLLFKANHVS